MFNINKMIGALTMIMATGQYALANTDVSWCVYDVAGTQGDVSQLMKDYTLAAKSWGVNMKTKTYTSDEKAAADYRAQKCDAVVASTFATKSMNNFTGSIGAVGLIPNMQVARGLFLALAHPNVAQHMVNNGHEVVGWIPLGTAYFMVKDRSLNSITDLAGRRLSVLRSDPSQERMARRVGAQPINVTFDNISQKFLNNEVDILAAPIYAYQPLELNKALAEKGGVINFPISYISLNLMIRQSAFPKDYGQKSRQWFKARTPQMIQKVAQWEKTLPARYWYDIPVADRSAYQRLVSQLRKEFVQNKTYHPTMLDMALRLTCVSSPEYFECKR